MNSDTGFPAVKHDTLRASTRVYTALYSAGTFLEVILGWCSDTPDVFTRKANMTSIAKWSARLIVVALLFVTGVRAQNTDVVTTQFVKILDFAELEYPTLARHARIQGVVVLRVQLDDRGNVISATAISGSTYLVPDSIENVKKWHFEATAARPMIIVYDFRISDGLCAGPCRSQFLIWPPNFATITTGSEPIGAGVSVPTIPAVHKEGLSLVQFVDLAYPLFAQQARVQGVVVVQIQVDKHGNVVSAEATSGPAMLILTCIENAKKWRFSPGKPTTSVIVYDFELDSGLAECHLSCRDSVSVRGPNFVTIIGGNLILETVDSRYH